MKANRSLIAGICLLAAAIVNFCLAFKGNGNDFAIRIFDGIFFSVGVFLTWKEWKKRKQEV